MIFLAHHLLFTLLEIKTIKNFRNLQSHEKIFAKSLKLLNHLDIFGQKVDFYLEKTTNSSLISEAISPFLIFIFLGIVNMNFWKKNENLQNLFIPNLHHNNNFSVFLLI